MIIKDKPFHIPACQAMSCAFYYPAGVFLHEVAIPESVFCTQGLVRRWPGFVKLEAYQVRLSRLLVLRRLGRVRGCRHWDDGLFHAGGAL